MAVSSCMGNFDTPNVQELPTLWLYSSLTTTMLWGYFWPLELLQAVGASTNHPKRL